MIIMLSRLIKSMSKVIFCYMRNIENSLAVASKRFFLSLDVFPLYVSTILTFCLYIVMRYIYKSLFEPWKDNIIGYFYHVFSFQILFFFCIDFRLKFQSPESACHVCFLRPIMRFLLLFKPKLEDYKILISFFCMSARKT